MALVGQYRSGFQLLELIVTLSTASLLIAGTTTAMYLASKSQDLARQSHNEDSTLQSATHRLLADLAEIKQIQSRTQSSIAFQVADRDGDGQDDTIQYQWNGNSGPLLFSDTGNTWWNLSNGLSHFEFAYPTTTAQSQNQIGNFDPPGQFVFQSATHEQGASSTATTIFIPGTFTTGDLLVAAVGVEGDQQSSITESTGWTKITETTTSGAVTLAIFYSLSPVASSAQFNWLNSGRFQCCVAHFQASSGTATITAMGTNEGTSDTAMAPAVLISKADSLLLRFIVCDQEDVIEESTNLPGHVPVLFRSNESKAPALGIAHRQASSGYAAEEHFHLSSHHDYVTASVVVSP